jgi:hypothetical protein
MVMKDLNIPAGGLYAKAVVVSHSAATGISKKDGSRWVRIQHELATQPGLIVLEQYCDPATVPEIKIEGGKVTAYPHFKDMESIVLKVGRYRVDRERLIIQSAEKLG